MRSEPVFRVDDRDPGVGEGSAQVAVQAFAAEAAVNGSILPLPPGWPVERGDGDAQAMGFGDPG